MTLKEVAQPYRLTQVRIFVTTFEAFMKWRKKCFMFVVINN